MTLVSDAAMNDVKAGIACEIAKLMPKGEKIDCVSKSLQVDADEAMRLIQRGRRIERQRTSAA